MPTLTLNDLRDPAPPMPGPAQRAAVSARARQLSHRRRLAQIGGALAVVAVLGVGGAIVVASDPTSNRVTVAPLASVRGSTTSIPVKTLRLTFTHEDGSIFIVDANPDGTFFLSAVPVGDYRVVWVYEEEGVDPGSGTQIGTALRAGKTSMTVNLGSGFNTVNIPL